MCEDGPVKRLHQFALVCLACIVAVAPTTASESDSASAPVVDLLNRAEALIQLGVTEKGGGRSFEDALDLVDAAAEHLANLVFHRTSDKPWRSRSKRSGKISSC